MPYTDPLLDKARQEIAAEHLRQAHENMAERAENDRAHLEHEQAFAVAHGLRSPTSPTSHFE